MDLLITRLKDSRSKKVVFVSHCILNENTRYLGGAFRSNIVDEIIKEIQFKNYGIIQLPCPEQKAWGGILKPYLWKIIGSKSHIIYHFRKIIFPFFIMHSKRIYRKIAREVVSQIKDYRKNGFDIIGIIGIGSSPTCGIKTTLDLEQYELLTEINIQEINRNQFNNLLYTKFIKNGEGLFIKILKRELNRSNLLINFYEHDLRSEINNTIKPILP